MTATSGMTEPPPTMTFGAARAFFSLSVKDLVASRANESIVSYKRFYGSHIQCDFCGQLTRGRRFAKGTEVLCGSCSRVLRDAQPPSTHNPTGG